MFQKLSHTLSALYDADETAWLEMHAQLLNSGRIEEIDAENLAEYLSDMARRDRREVNNRLIVLICHLLKWKHQPERRCRSWQTTILEQKRELRLLLESRTLRNHAGSILSQAYVDGCNEAMTQSNLKRDSLPADCEWNLESLLGHDDDLAVDDLPN